VAFGKRRDVRRPDDRRAQITSERLRIQGLAFPQAGLSAYRRHQRKAGFHARARNNQAKRRQKK